MGAYHFGDRVLNFGNVVPNWGSGRPTTTLYFSFEKPFLTENQNRSGRQYFRPRGQENRRVISFFFLLAQIDTFKV